VIEPLKLYFDACCSKTLPPELLAFFRPNYPTLQTAHVLDHHKQDTGDSDWLSPLRDKSWIPITSDRGEDRKKERLPVICMAWGITHVVITATLIRKGPTAQKQAIVAVWSELFHLDRYVPGTQVVLGEAGASKTGRTRYALRVKGEICGAASEGSQVSS
jgi:hypothetical protein